MSRVQPAPPAVDDAEAARHAGRDWLSLALIESRNATLRWLAAFEAAGQAETGEGAALPPARWIAGHAAWHADWWIVRHVQAQRGDAADPTLPRLAAADAMSDAIFHADRRGRGGALPADGLVRAWMADTLETVLDLLAAVRDDDDARLHPFRQALRAEDRAAETMAALAQARGLAAAPWPEDPPLTADPGAIAFPPGRWSLGSPPGGGVPGPERWAHEVRLPEFEIDARPVSWARYLEFVRDGGYDDPRWWSPAGWAWLQRRQRRAPRYVEQMGQGVALQRRGRLERAAPGRPAVHVARHEAEAWCAWAGRRLPTEAEWELAACGAGARGFAWGEVLEWVAGRARGWPGHADPPGEIDPLPHGDGGDLAVLRGACSATPRRAAHPRARRFAEPEADAVFTGFRSCAL